MATKKKTNKATSAVRGKRYTAQEKAEILTFIDNYNAKNGRGGATQAHKKYGVSQITLGNWARKAGKTTSSVSRKTPKDISGVLKSLGSIHQKMAKKEEELAALRKEYSALKAQL